MAINDQTCDKFRYYHYKSFNTIGQTRETFDMRVAETHKYELEKFKSAKYIISTKASQEVRKVFNQITSVTKSTENTNEFITSDETRMTQGNEKTTDFKYSYEKSINYADNSFGFMQQRIRVQFLDETVDLLLSESIINIDKLSTIYFENMFEFDMYDNSIIELAKSKMKLKKSNIDKKNTFETFIAGTTFVEFVDVTQYIQNHEWARSHSYSVTDLGSNGHTKDHVSFRLASKQTDSEWVPLVHCTKTIDFEFIKVTTVEHIYTTNPKKTPKGFAVQETIGYVANTQRLNHGLVAVYEHETVVKKEENCNNRDFICIRQSWTFTDRILSVNSVEKGYKSNGVVFYAKAPPEKRKGAKKR